MFTSSLIWSVATSGGGGADYPAELNIVCIGDSITYGTKSADPGGTTSYPALLAANLGMTFNTDVHNQGVPSRITADLPDVDYLLDGEKQNIACLMIGVNDIYVANQSAQDTFDRIEAYVELLESKGWRVVIGTITGNNVGNGTTYARGVALNVLLSGLASPTRTIAAVGANPNIGTATNGIPQGATYFDSDGLHFITAGNQEIADCFEPAILAAAPVVAPEIQTSYGISRDSTAKVWIRGRNVIQPNNGQAFTLNNLLKPKIEDVYASYSEAASAAPPLRVTVGGHPAIRYSGGADAGAADDIGYHTFPTLQLSSFISASSFYFQMVLVPRSFTTNNSPARTNSGAFGSSVAHVGLYMKQPNLLIFEQNYDTEVQAEVDVDQVVVVGIRLHGGMLSIEINGSVVESKACANVADLTENLRIAQSYFGTHEGHFDLLDFIIRNSGAANTDAAYAIARYGL